MMPARFGTLKSMSRSDLRSGAMSVRWSISCLHDERPWRCPRREPSSGRQRPSGERAAQTVPWKRNRGFQNVGERRMGRENPLRRRGSRARAAQEHRADLRRPGHEEFHFTKLNGEVVCSMNRLNGPARRAGRALHVLGARVKYEAWFAAGEEANRAPREQTDLQVIRRSGRRRPRTATRVKNIVAEDIFAEAFQGAACKGALLVHLLLGLRGCLDDSSLRHPTRCSFPFWMLSCQRVMELCRIFLSSCRCFIERERATTTFFA